MHIFTFKQKLRIALPVIAALLCLTTLTAFSQKPELYVSTGHTDLVDTVAFSPDGKTLASASFDKTIKFWDSATGQELKTFKGNLRDVYRVAFALRVE